MPRRDPEKTRIYNREHYQKNKAKYFEKAKRHTRLYKARNKEFINNYKMKIGCKFCGYNKFHGALEFHHLDPTKKDFEIAEMVTFASIKTLQDEIDKCIVICSNCHREVHGGFITGL